MEGESMCRYLGCLVAVLLLGSAVATAGLVKGDTASAAKPRVTVNSGIEAKSYSPIGLTPSQLRAAYQLPSTGGSGQTVAIVAPGDNPNAEKDLIQYRNMYGLPLCTEANGCFRKRNEVGGTRYPNASQANADEISLDLAMASAACPQCDILLVEAKPNLNSMLAAEDKAVELGATVVSNSWSYEEVPGEEVTKANSHFNHPGIPITAASGDWGYNDYLKGGPSVNFPASSQHVVAVGGTTLTKAPETGRGWIDTVWPKSGSGCSEAFAKPAWQEDSGCSNRTISDVAAVAEEVSVYASYKRSEPWVKMWGTSASAPFIAGILAQASEKVREQPGKTLYANLKDGIGSVLDVTPRESFNNVNHPSCGGAYICSAQSGETGNSIQGYDGPTGVGVPQGLPTLPKWSSPTVPTPWEGEGYPSVDAIACSANDACFAVGATYFSNENQFKPLALKWAGTEWTAESLPIPYGPAGEGWLEDVSCPSAAFCIAVGSYWNGPGAGTYQPWAAKWNGSAWSLEYPPSAGFSYNYLTSISCVSATECMAIGWNGSEPYAERLTAEGWSVMEIPLPGSEPYASLEAISCVPNKPSPICWAVGSFLPEEGETQALVEKWDGKAWTAVEPPELYEYGELRDISCTNPRACVAVGSDGGLPITQVLDGTTWEQDILPPWVQPLAVSCASPTSCMLVGESEPEPVAMNWNGVSWMSSGVPSVSGELRSVECTAVAECLTLGTRPLENWTGEVIGHRYSE
jgi:Subtilase family